MTGVSWLYAGAENVLPTQTALTLNSGTYSIFNPSHAESGVVPGNYNQSIGSLSGNGSLELGSATLTIGSDNTSTAFTGPIAGNGGSLTKVGDGVLILNGALTYTGATNIASGKLVIDNVLPITILHEISGTGELVVAGSTNLTATSINVGTLTITGRHRPFAATPVPETNTFLLLIPAAVVLDLMQICHEQKRKWL